VRSLFIRGLSGDFSTMTVDGEQVANSNGSSQNRSFQIEEKGTTDLKAVEVIKAPTPDQDANAIGGTVNLVTKRALDHPGRQLSVTVGASWKNRHYPESPFQAPPRLGVETVAYSNTFDVFGGKNNLGVALDYTHRISNFTQDEPGPGGILVGTVGGVYVNPTSANPLTREWGSRDFQNPQDSHDLGFAVRIPGKSPNLPVRETHSEFQQSIPDVVHERDRHWHRHHHQLYTGQHLRARVLDRFHHHLGAD